MIGIGIESGAQRADRLRCGRAARRTPGIIFAGLLMLCFLASEHARPSVAEGRPLFTGVAGLDTYDPLAFARVQMAGAQFVHIPLFWSDVAPQARPDSWDPADPADPHYDWTQIDQAVSRAVEAKLTPVVLIDGAPVWAQGCRAPGALAGRLCEPDPGALASFAMAAATRYGGAFQGLPRVRYWQGLNEPNLTLFFNPQFEHGKAVSPTLYRHLINSFYAAVKSVEPSDIVIAAGLGPIARPQATIGPMRFTRELLCMGGRRNPHPVRSGECKGGVHFDVFDIHPYTTGGPTHTGHADDVELGDLDKLQELLRAADRFGRIKGRTRHTPLWICEFSWDSKPPDPGGVPMGILSRWTSEALFRAWSAGIDHFAWYGLRDTARDPSLPFSETLESGLFFRGDSLEQDRPKPMLQAFRFPFVAYREHGNISYWGRTSESTAGGVVIEMQTGGDWKQIEVAHADRSGIFSGVATRNVGAGRRGLVRARFERETSVPFSLRPVKDHYQPPFG